LRELDLRVKWGGEILEGGCAGKEIFKPFSLLRLDKKAEIQV
jgi:hypothetical protein